MRFSFVLLLCALLAQGCQAPVRRPPPRQDPEEAPKAPRRAAPVLVKAIIHILDRNPRERGLYNVVFQVQEVLRGELERAQFAVTDLRAPRRSFPWIKGGAYAGAEVFVHLRPRAGDTRVVGFSQTATGLFYELR